MEKNHRNIWLEILDFIDSFQDFTPIADPMGMMLCAARLSTTIIVSFLAHVKTNVEVCYQLLQFMVMVCTIL